MCHRQWMDGNTVAFVVVHFARDYRVFQKCVAPSTWLNFYLSIPPAPSALIFAAWCMELDSWVLAYDMGERGRSESQERGGGKGMMAVKGRWPGLHRSSLPSPLLHFFPSIFMFIYPGRSNVFTQGLDWVTDGPDVTALPSTSYI